MAHQPFHLPAREGLAPAGAFAVDSAPDAPPEGERWTSWDRASHGPGPLPEWVVTDLGAVDADLGVLKTGKEADVHLVRRWVPGTGRACLMAAKRYRSADHRLFHRDSGYLEGRRVRKSREMRAMARRTAFGKEMIAGQWAMAEFATLSRLWAEGLPVPYPVQLDETEMLMELVGSDGAVAPRLVQLRPGHDELADLFEQLRGFMLDLVELGWTHGDLSPYNVLVPDGDLVVIDWPQVVDVVGNPRGMDFLDRDLRTMCTWFVRRGLEVDVEELVGEVCAAAFG
ncbi:serine protein kinase RIO [Janibacter melonis]|uniref:serine protein kinase RIO n=1 Tax=Janibacter melonis TaxID=262209 RepID=UPI001919E879|nr:RIO1 family regulatory kinase/ATPase [Janibacter melonis]